MDELDHHLEPAECLDGHLRLLYHRAALLHDRKEKSP
jgi:hypothetical protein